MWGGGEGGSGGTTPKTTAKAAKEPYITVC